MLGERVGGYDVVELLGKGGMGVVYVAEHHLLKSRAVVKVLRAELSKDSDMVERFFKEAKAASQIDHPGIVKIFDYGLLATGDAYIVMEKLEGEPLTARIRKGPITASATSAFGRQIASALGAAHDRGIIHRDLKPDNVFLVRDPDLPEGERVKILDFGIAKLATSSGADTSLHSVFGTPRYMSPEQCQSASQVDARTDIYALGCILYEMVTGNPPFTGATVAQLVSAHMFEPPIRASAIVRSLPLELDAAIMRALSKTVDERQASMRDVASELAKVGAPGADAVTKRSIAAPPVVPVNPVAETEQGVGTTLDASHGQLETAPAPKRRIAVIAGGVVAVTAFGMIAWSPWSGRTEVVPNGLVAPVPVSPDATTHTPPPADTPDHEAAWIAGATQVFHSFQRWARDHTRSPCPSIHDVAGDAAHDPWGERYAITCTDQPDGQIIGVVSAGPDRTMHTDDDHASWTDPMLAKSMTGPRWRAVPRSVSPVPRSAPHPTPDAGVVVDDPDRGIPKTR